MRAVRLSARAQLWSCPRGALACAAICLTGCSGEIFLGADFAAGSDAGSLTLPTTTMTTATMTTTATSTVEAGAALDASLDSGASSGGDASITGDASIDASGMALLVPWSTGFEDGFPDWSSPAGQGYCYVESGATYAIVTSPVHSGNYAAAFTVNTAKGSLALPSQARCVRQGVLPPAAYYGAWYYIPGTATLAAGNWNLLHFQGGDGPDASNIHGLWDVSLVTPGTSLVTQAYDFLDTTTLDGGLTVPINQWFHLEVFLRPAANGTGQFTVTQDGQVVATVSGIETDDSMWGQWYVGNFATALSPSMFTVYVDDVTIGTMPSSP